MHTGTTHGLEIHTISLNSDSFTLYDGDKVAADYLCGSEIEDAAIDYRNKQANEPIWQDQ